MYVYLYVQVVGFIKWTLRSWLGWCSMVWTCSLHAGWYLQRTAETFISTYRRRGWNMDITEDWV